MKEVKIAEFKSKLSSHLRQVRQGEEVIILDRNQPIAKVIPFQDPRDRLVIHKAKKKGQLKSLKFPGIKAKVDVVKLLREDRDRR